MTDAAGSARQAGRDPPTSSTLDPSTIHTRAELARALDAHPDAATPALVRQLKERVETLYRTDARASRELAACVQLAAARAGDLGSLALAHRARALAALASGSRKEALASYNEAERLYQELGDEIERARVQRSMIDALMHLGRYDEALAVAQEARTVFERHGLTRLAAEVDANVGSVYHRLDRNAESLEAYERALDVFRREGAGEAVAMMEFNRANIFANLNEWNQAERGYRRALRFYRAAEFGLREAQCLYALAYLAFLRSRFSAALRLYARVRALDLDLGDERHAALCQLDQAELFLSLNAWDDAAGLAGEAQEDFEKLGMGYEAAKAILYRGLAAVHLFDPLATELFTNACARFRSEGNRVYVGLTLLYQAEHALHRGLPADAVGPARRAIRLFARSGLPAKEAYAHIVLAGAFERLADPALACRHGRLALERLERTPSASVACRAHHLLGRLERDPETRRRHLDEALALVERLRTHILPDELHAAFQRDKIAIYTDRARLMLEEDGAAGLASAFAVLERAKSRILDDHLAGRPRRRAAEALGGADRGPEAWEEQLEALNHCYRKLNAAETGGRARSIAEPLRREIEQRELRLTELHRSLELDRTLTAPRPDADLSLLARIQGGLAADEALIEYFFLDDSLHAFVIRRQAMHWIPALSARGPVRRALAAWHFQVNKTTLGAPYRAAHASALRAGALDALERLTTLVWKPLVPWLTGVRQLVIVPAGPLSYVPFHALRADGSFLIDHFAISQAGSGRGYCMARDRQGARSGPPLVLGVEHPDLPSIDHEMAALRRHLPGARVLRGEQASRGALRRFGPGAAVIHLASHAHFRTDNPLLSAIELADGRLTFYDLSDFRLDAGLVVLSGCQTGHQQILEGDEQMGLARGFLYAGSASLLTSLWPVDDDATAAFMECFYRHLGAGGGARLAVQQSMRERIAAGAPPHEWAPFYLSGNPD